MKKIIGVFLVLCLFLTGCSSSFNFDESVTKLQDAGYTITLNYTTQEELDTMTNEANSILKMHGKDSIVEAIRCMAVYKGEDGCVFIQFKTKEQARSYYDVRVEMRFENSVLRLGLYDDTVLIADCEEVVDILDLKFN